MTKSCIINKLKYIGRYIDNQNISNDLYKIILELETEDKNNRFLGNLSKKEQKDFSKLFLGGNQLICFIQYSCSDGISLCLQYKTKNGYICMKPCDEKEIDWLHNIYEKDE